MKHRPISVTTIRLRLLSITLITVFALPHAIAQQMPTATQTANEQAPSSVPSLINYTGALLDLNGKALSGIQGVTFLLYSSEFGGSPLWLETQNVTAGRTGQYSVTLGSTTSQGLPADVFASGEARWLAVQVAGQPEQPRVLLVAVPYALKAADAQTIGGLPPSAFMLANQSRSGAGTGITNASSAAPSAKSSTPPANPAVTGKGAVDFIPMWDTTSDIVDSILFQKGSQVGVNTTAPAATLDINGKADVRDTLTLFPKSTDTTVAISGTTFKIDSTGKMTFISGQTFPGTGTITGITTASGSGLSGGGTKGTLTLTVASAGITNNMLANPKVTLNGNTAGGLTTPGTMTLGGTYTIGLKPCSANQILQYSGSVWNCASAGAGTITGVTAGTDLLGGGTTGTVTLNVDTTKVAQLASNNAFTGLETITGNSGLNALLNVTNTATNGGNGIQTFVNNASGFSIYGGNSGSGSGVGGTSNGAGYGLYGTSSTGDGVYGQASVQGSGVYGNFAGPSNLGSGSGQIGVWGDSSSGIGVLGSSDSNIAVYGESTSSPAVYGASNAAEGLFGFSNSSDGVFGFSSSQTGVSAYSSSFVGAYGEYSTNSGTGSGFSSAGVWGDTGSVGGFGVLGTTDDAYALYGKNNGGYATLWAENDAPPSNGSYGPSIATFSGSGNTYCTIVGDPNNLGSGDLICTGSKSAAVPVDGNHMVRLYAMEAAENWFEDAGSAQLSEGKAVVSLDGLFAQTVNGDLDYHVFLTPNGDCEGLYIASKGSHGFEVRELHSGHSSIAFDYRIMARRKGYEHVRMEDVTAQFEMNSRQSREVATRVNANKAAHRVLKRQEPSVPKRTSGRTAAAVQPKISPIPVWANAKK